MKPRDQQRISKLPEAERLAAIEEEKKKIFAAGGKAKTALLYLEGYFDRKKKEFGDAFAALPRDAELREYQAVHNGLIALMELEQDINNRIRDADREALEPLEIKDIEANI